MQVADAGKSMRERAPWVGEFDPLSGVVPHEQIELMPEAAEMGRIAARHLAVSATDRPISDPSLGHQSGTGLESGITQPF
jgi:hypothetical protein